MLVGWEKGVFFQVLEDSRLYDFFEYFDYVGSQGDGSIGFGQVTFTARLQYGANYSMEKYWDYIATVKGFSPNVKYRDAEFFFAHLEYFSWEVVWAWRCMAFEAIDLTFYVTFVEIDVQKSIMVVDGKECWGVIYQADWIGD